MALGNRESTQARVAAGVSVGQTPGMIRRLAHLCLFTDQLDRLVAFYRDGLGLPVKFRFLAQDEVPFGAYLDCGDSTFVEIFDQAGAAKQWGGTPGPLEAGNRYGHLCFEVTGLAEEVAALRDRGIEVGPISTGIDGSLQAWTADPDGNKVELMEYTHGSQQLQLNGNSVRGLK